MCAGAIHNGKNLCTSVGFAADVLLAEVHGELLRKWAIGGGYDLYSRRRFAADVLNHRLVSTLRHNKGIAGSATSVDVLDVHCRGRGIKDNTVICVASEPTRHTGLLSGCSRWEDGEFITNLNV